MLNGKGEMKNPMLNGTTNRTAKGCKNKWNNMNNHVMKFLAYDILSTRTVIKSGHREEDRRKDVQKYFIERHGKELAD